MSASDVHAEFSVLFPVFPTINLVLSCIQSPERSGVLCILACIARQIQEQNRKREAGSRKEAENGTNRNSRREGISQKEVEEGQNRGERRNQKVEGGQNSGTSVERRTQKDFCTRIWHVKFLCA